MPKSPALLLIPALLVLPACSRTSTSETAAPEPRVVEVVEAVRARLGRSVSAVGTLAAKERAELSFKVPGRLQRLLVDIGSPAAAGQLLAQLAPEDYELRRQRARAALLQARARLGLPPDGDSDEVVPEETGVVRQARARLDEAAAQLARSRSLLADGVLSRSALDVVEAAHEVADSQWRDSLEEVRNRQAVLAERRSDLALAEQQLRDSSLRAPFDGAVQARRAGLGEYVAAGTPVLTLVQLSPIRLRLEVPEREARNVQNGRKVTVRVEGDPTEHRGVVARTSPAFDEASRSLVVEAEIPNPRGLLKPGSFARAEIEAEPGEPSLVVPASAVVAFAGIERVITVKDGKALEKPVTTGRRAGELVEIAGGLSIGDPVVVSPGNLATGVPVTVRRAGAVRPGGPGVGASGAGAVRPGGPGEGASGAGPAKPGGPAAP